MTDSSAPATQVVADIGGTNARFACVASAGETTKLTDIHSLPCADYANVRDAVLDYLQHIGNPAIQQLCLAVAAPIVEDRIVLPNNHWQFSQRELAAGLDTELTVLNDFSAQMLGIPGYRNEELHWLGPARPECPRDDKVLAALGPGTGLGVSALLPSGEVLPSEGGHVSFAPINAHEVQLLDTLWQRYQRVSVERILSGAGLANLYWANSRLQGQEKEKSAPDIAAGARDGDALCTQAVRDFFGILGSVAGDMALATGATGGVYISGGMVPKMLDLLDEELFRDRFNAKGRFSALCENTPLAVILADNPGLQGCARALMLASTDGRTTATRDTPT